jgi:hypothetical protein
MVVSPNTRQGQHPVWRDGERSKLLRQQTTRKFKRMFNSLIRRHQGDSGGFLSGAIFLPHPGEE